MAARTIDGPEKDNLTLEEVAVYLTVESRTIRRLIAEGKFPRGIPISKGKVVWSALDVAVYRAWQERLDRLRPGKTAEDDDDE